MNSRMKFHMNREQYLLTKLAEECNEIAQDALKTQQFGFHSYNPDTGINNTQYLTNELNDLFAILEMLEESGYFMFMPCPNAISEKKEKVEKYLKLSQNLGKVDSKDA